MEVESAFAALDLAGPVPQSALKRAYLKAVRKHPPERDPEGFRRVRDAFEWLEARPWLCAATGSSETPPTWSEPRQPLQAATPPAQPEPEPELRPGPELDSRLSSTEPCPAGLDRDPPDLDFDALVEPIDPEALVELGHGVLRAIAPARSLSSYPPPPHLVVELVLRLIEANEANLASDLVEAFQRALDEQFYPLRALHGETIGVWQLVREVEDLRGEVPGKLRRKLSRGIREGDFEEAITVFERMSTERGPELRVAFQREAPTLYAAVWPRVDREAAGFDPKPNAFGSIAIWRWIGLILILARCAFSSSDRPARSTYVSPPPPVVAASSTSEPRDVQPPLADRDFTARQRERIERVIDEAILRHDCTSLIEQWPLYENSFVAVEETPALVAARENKRRAADSACPELVSHPSKNP
jgi:hypothetical protein